MKRFHFEKLTFCSIALSALSACDRSVFTGREARDLQPTSLIEPSSVVQGGCLNIRLLRERMRNFPVNLPVREVTSDIQIQRDAGFNENSELVLFKGAFLYHEESSSKLGFLSDVESIEQIGCSAVLFHYNDGSDEDIKITLSGPQEIEMIDETNESTIQVTLVNSQSLRVKRSYQAMDFCPNFKTARISQMVMIHWGPELAGPHVPEMLSSEMLRRVTAPLAEIPSSLRSLGESTTLVSSQDLQALFEAPVRSELLVCERYEPDHR